MTGSLDGQVAVVTGAGTGVGAAAAAALAAVGARVALVGRRPEPLNDTAAGIAAAGGEAAAFPADVSDDTAAQAVIDGTVSRWGRLDVLVNNAGINVPERHLERVSVEDWRRILEINLTGPFLLTRLALVPMRRQGSGTVVNVSSYAGWRPTLLTGPAYTASKAALISFTDSINLAERGHGIRACTVCPGEVNTPIMEDRPHPPSAEARATMLQPEDVAEVIRAVVALPQRAAVELVILQPTTLRDLAAESRPRVP